MPVFFPCYKRVATRRALFHHHDVPHAPSRSPLGAHWKDKNAKDGKTPYVSHVVRVCCIVRNVFGFDDPAMLQTALVYDTVEDTTTDFDDLAKEFSTAVAGWVAALTKDKRLADDDRESAYLSVLKACRGTGKSASSPTFTTICSIRPTRFRTPRQST